MLAKLRRNLARTLARYRTLGAARALWLHVRAAGFGLGLRGRRCHRPDRPERVVITLTTIPARARTLGPVLNSLLAQSVPADDILLALPRRALRGGDYPAIADLRLPAGVRVLSCDDLGPATKVLPALLAEPDAVIVVVDDDVIYPPDFIARLLAAHRRAPDVAWGLRGVCLQQGRAFPELDHILCGAISQDQAVDILFGTWGYLVPPHALDGAVHDYSGAPDAVRWVDDVWISGHLARRGIARRVIAAPTLPVETLASYRQALTDGPNRSGENDAAAIAVFAGDWGVRADG